MSPKLYHLARRALFKLDAEHAHDISLQGLRWAESLHLLKLLAGSQPESSPVECMGLTFPNRVGLAAGLDKTGACIDALGRFGFGHIEIGTITPRPQAGNPQPRLFRLLEHDAIINRMGFNNPGIHTGVANVSDSRSFKGIIGFNIGKNKDTPNENATDDYLTCFRAAYPVADYIAINISSPNTPGLRDLQSADSVAELVEQLQNARHRLAEQYGKQVPIALKVAPDLTSSQIAELSKAFLQVGLDGLIATNTTLDRSAVEGAPFAAQAGGLSGAPLHQRSTDVIAEFHSHLGNQIPIIAVGGIDSADHAKAKINAGARLIQLYTGFIYQGPPLVAECLHAFQ